MGIRTSASSCCCGVPPLFFACYTGALPFIRRFSHQILFALFNIDWHQCKSSISIIYDLLRTSRIIRSLT